MMKPEGKLAQKFKAFMEYRGWTVMNTHGNVYQQGLPDKYCIHKDHGQRWVELKIVDRFTKYQLYYFPLFHLAKIGVWVLKDINEKEYEKLFQSPNWLSVLGKAQMEKVREKHPGLF